MNKVVILIKILFSLGNKNDANGMWLRELIKTIHLKHRAHWLAYWMYKINSCNKMIITPF